VQAIKRIYVNLVDLEHIGHQGNEEVVQRFPTEVALSEYTKGSGKIYKRKLVPPGSLLKVTAHRAGSFPTTPCISGSIELAIDRFFTLPSTQVCNLSAPRKLVDTIWLMADRAVPLTEHKQIEANPVHLGHKMGTIYKIWTNTINYNLNHCAGHLHPTILQCFHQK